MFVYVIRSKKDGSLYVGLTKDVDKRIEMHNKGFNLSTRKRAPWELVRKEEFLDRNMAFKREKFLKTGRGRAVLNNLLGRSL